MMNIYKEKNRRKTNRKKTKRKITKRKITKRKITKRNKTKNKDRKYKLYRGGMEGVSYDGDSYNSRYKLKNDMERGDEQLESLSSLNILDMVHLVEEFDNQDCKEIGRLCQTDRQYRDYCKDDRVHYKYIIPCKIDYDIKQLLKQIIITHDGYMSRGGDTLDNYSNISEMDIFTYLKAYLSWSPFEVTDHKIYVKLDTQTIIWGVRLPQLPGDRKWNDLFTEEEFMEYVSVMDAENFLTIIQNIDADADYETEMGIASEMVDTLSMYEIGSLSWWTTALICRTYAQPVLNLKPKVGREVSSLHTRRNKVLHALFSSEEEGFGSFNGGLSVGKSSVKEVWDSFTNIYSNDDDDELGDQEIHVNNTNHKKYFMSSGMEIFESIAGAKTILSEYFHEYIYLLNFMGDDTEYEYLPHMEKFKRPWQIEADLEKIIFNRLLEDMTDFNEF